MKQDVENTKSLIIDMIKCYSVNDYTSVKKIMISGGVDWGFFCEKVIKNKLENLAWIVFNKCVDFEELVPFYIREFLAKLYYINRERIDIYNKYFKDISGILSDNDVEYAVVKGISLEHDLYDNDYVKRISDVDMLIHKDDASKVKKLFGSLGMSEGRFNYISNNIEPLSREKQMFYKMTSDHLPEHFYMTDERICPFLKIDVSTSFDWINRKENSLMSSFLKENVVMQRIDNCYSISTLEPTAHFIYLLNHFHRHAWSYRFITRDISIRLCMTNDIYMYWHKHKEEIKSNFGKYVLEKKDKERISWALYYIDQLYCCNIQREMQMENYMKNINCAFGKNETIVKWDGNIEERIWAYRERDVFSFI